jgi:uncharacterized protein with von Willebrand factor type A (vWA) domain
MQAVTFVKFVCNWQYRQSISIIQQLVSNRMFPLTLKGLEDAMRMLSK